ncbi:MAG: 2-hydroxyacyl-CoA dehydratase, partial [Bacteroidales bacterium]|nr:2-hydroxyacyl-CoA dehydratase [Bacteroidales bacterium]
CKGCENQCTINVFKFDNGNTFYAGNNCEKIFTNKSDSVENGVNLHAEKETMLFENTCKPSNSNGKKVGLPRALGMYENFQFWQAMFTSLGYEVVLSGDSTNKLYEPGVKSIMSDNICFPAKLMNGHVIDLVNKKVDFIFYPYIVYEAKEDEKSANSYNCPIVSGYGDVIKSSIDTQSKYGIRFDNPIITFSDQDLLFQSCDDYLKTLGFEKKQRKSAILAAIKAQNNFKEKLTKRTAEVIENANQNNRMVIVLAGRPYHIDPLIQHKVSQSISEMGIDVVTENVSYLDNENIFDEIHSLTQWSFPTRVFKAAHYAANADNNVQFIELTSFGCGPDAFILDEIGSILNRKGKNLTILKIDDVNNIGSLRLRIRSLVESIRMNTNPRKTTEFKTTPVFEEKDKNRKIIAPYFGEGYSEFLTPAFKMLGYDLEILPKGTPESNEFGLKYANNDICYPATIVIGSIMQALESGKYNPDEIAVCITQTGGQCRASNYLSLIKNAMVAAGFTNTPVIS